MAERPDSKPCSACGEPILRLASRCKHCGARVRDADAPGSALQVAAGLSGRVVAGAGEAGSAPVAPGSSSAPAGRDASAPTAREASAPLSTGAERWAPPGAYIPPGEPSRAAPVTLGADTVASPPPTFSSTLSSPPAALAASAPTPTAAPAPAPAAAPLSFGASTQLAPGGPPPPAQEPRAPVAFSFTRPGAAEPTPEAPTTDGDGLDELDHRRRRLFSPATSSAAPSLPPAPRGGRPRALDEEAPTGLVLNPEAAPPASEPEPEPAGRGAYFDPRVAPLAPRAPAPATPQPPAPEPPRPEAAAAPAPPAASVTAPEPDAPELAPGLLGWTAASAADDHIPRVVSIATGLIGLMLFLTPWAYGPEEGVVMPMALFSEGLSAQVLLPLVASLALLVSGFLPSLTAAGRGVLLLVAGLAGTLSLSLAAPEFFPGDIELSAPVALGVCCLLAATVARATRSNSGVARTLAVIGIIFIAFAYLLPREIAGKRGQPLELIANGMTGGTARTLAHAWALLPALLAVSVAVVFRGPERERDSAGRISAWLAVVLATYVPLAFVFGGAAVVGGDRAMATLAWKMGLLGVCYSVWIAVGAMPVLDSWWRSSNEQRKRAAVARAAALAQQATMAAQGPPPPPLGYQGAAYQPHYPAPGAPFSPQPAQYPPPPPYQQHAPAPPPPAAAPPPPAASDVASRLQVLTELRDRGLITAAEYEDRRRTILERI